jgi:hypothetical protein
MLIPTFRHVAEWFITSVVPWTMEVVEIARELEWQGGGDWRYDWHRIYPHEDGLEHHWNDINLVDKTVAELDSSCERSSNVSKIASYITEKSFS